MYLTIIIVLVVGQMYLEYVIVKALHLEELNKRFILGNLAFSVTMSIGFGMLFPAAGMVIAAAGLISTILSQPMYRFIGWYTKEIKPQAIKIANGYRTNRSIVHETLEDIWKIIKFVGLIIRIPFRFIHFVVVGAEKIKGAKP